MSPYLNDKLSLFFTEVSFETSEENQLSYFQNGYVFKLFLKFHEPNNQSVGEVFISISRNLDIIFTTVFRASKQRLPFPNQCDMIL